MIAPRTARSASSLWGSSTAFWPAGFTLELPSLYLVGRSVRLLLLRNPGVQLGHVVADRALPEPHEGGSGAVEPHLFESRDREPDVPGRLSCSEDSLVCHAFLR